MKRFTTRILALTAILFSIAACGTPEVEEEHEKSNKCALVKFSFNSSANPGVTTTSAATANGYWFISVPEGTDLTRMVPEIRVSEGATVQIDDKPFTEGTACDFSGNIQKLRVISESGENSSVYKICVKYGNPYIDNKVVDFMDDFKIPGVSVSIMKGTEVVYSNGYGFANAANETRCTPDHLFRMASISKQFCTMCIMTLKEQGRLNLDDRVFGEGGLLEKVNFRVSDYHRTITVRHLLSHSSGICKGLSDPAFDNSYRFYSGSSRPVPTDTLIQRTLDARWEPDYDEGFSWTPGMGHNYSNVGFCILHRIVEVVSGKDYESFLKEDVLKKMGITDTHIGGYLDQRRANECVYYSQGGGDGYSNPLREIAGAAGIITSTNQMMKILTYMDGDDTVPDIFSKETIQEMYTPYSYAGPGPHGSNFNQYGLGWRLNHSRLFQGAHYHGGNIAGTATIWVGNNNQHMSGAFVCNSRAYNNDSYGQSIDTAMYVLLEEFMNYFN